jgi:hypothetical protein
MVYPEQPTGSQSRENFQPNLGRDLGLIKTSVSVSISGSHRALSNSAHVNCPSRIESAAACLSGYPALGNSSMCAWFTAACIRYDATYVPSVSDRVHVRYSILRLILHGLYKETVARKNVFLRALHCDDWYILKHGRWSCSVLYTKIKMFSFGHA